MANVIVTSIIGMLCFLVSMNNSKAQTVDIIQLYTTDNSALPHNSINALSIDAHSLFIGTEGGIAQISNDQWFTYTSNNSNLPDDRVRSLYTPNGRIWAGTFIGGFCQYNNANWNIYNTANSGIIDNTVRCISPTLYDNRIWLGTTGGIAVWDSNNNIWSSYFNISPDLTLNNINRIVFDNYQTAWIATLNAGLIALDSNGEGFISYKINNSAIPDNSINDIVIDENNHKWFTTAFHGLVRLDTNGIFSTFNPSNSPLTTQQLTALTHDHNGKWLIGSQDAGLFIADINNNTWLHLYSGNANMPDDHITAILSESDSTAWIGTKNGGLMHIVYRDFATALPPIAQINKPNTPCLVYPNPAPSNTTLQIAALPNTQTDYLTAMMLNNQGKIVAQVPICQTDGSLQLPYLPNGSYYLKITSNKGMAWANLIIVN